MFDWARNIGISDFIFYLRQVVGGMNIPIPNWITLSVPDALWGYSLTAFMVVTWCNNPSNKNKLFWFSIGPAICILSELGQLTGMIKGTFDRIDLFLIIIFSLAPFIVLGINFKGEENEKKFV
jgi:hypothetical protein